jgi:UDP-glucose 4-epimerase
MKVLVAGGAGYIGAHVVPLIVATPLRLKRYPSKIRQASSRCSKSINLKQWSTWVDISVWESR